MTPRLWVILWHCLVLSHSYKFSVGPPPVSRRALAGLWKLTPLPTLALKEFTTYPKKQTKIPELLLMLKEDGSFKQYHQNEESEDLNQSWETFRRSKKSSLTAVQNGVWDLVDGRLVLAADRPEKEQVMDTKENLPDTLLEGQVVASWRRSREQHQRQQEETQKKEQNSRVKRLSEEKAAILDTRLSVPLGRINVGRFFYPKSHPSFFEQPMFHPEKLGAFSLSQVIGSLQQDPLRIHEDADLFERQDFYNKTFLLTSHPIVPKTPKGRKRWSIKYNDWVYDTKPEAKREAEEASKNPLLCKIMRIAFHPNGTFSTLPNNDAEENPTILRGKYDLTGPQNSQLWFQVWRFGFGRSVSGSTYSQGRMLTQDDAKTYWGTIGFQKIVNATKTERKNNSPEEDENRLEIKGSVLFGSGLEPLPVGRFIMRETDDLLLSLEDEEDEEEDEEDLRNIFEDRAESGVEDEGIDWNSGSGFE